MGAIAQRTIGAVAHWGRDTVARALPALALAALASSSARADGPNLVTNGSFESGDYSPLAGDGWVDVTTGMTKITGWSVVGHIDWGNTAAFTPMADGGRAIDVVHGGYCYGGGVGTISQTVPTVAGASYRLSFQLAAPDDDNPCSHRASGLPFKTVRVTVGGVPSTFSAATSNSLAVVWESKQLTFTATSSATVIAFEPNDSDDGFNGPGLDLVSVVVLDSDGDGHLDSADNCPDVSNADQADSDGNGRGDACPRPGYSVVGHGTVNCYDVWTGEPVGTDSNATVTFQLNYDPDTAPDYTNWQEGHYTQSAWYSLRQDIRVESTIGGFTLSDDRIYTFSIFAYEGDDIIYSNANRVDAHFGNGNWYLQGSEVVQDGRTLPEQPGNVSDSSYNFYSQFSNSLGLCVFDGSGPVQVLTDAPLDSDGDGVPDLTDLCPGSNDLDNADGDLLPDGCDACPADSANDADGDLLCADVDSCPNDPDNDVDADLACGDVDNCQALANLDQWDLDADGAGDACDDDDDGDGVGDATDNCAVLANAEQADLDLDGLGDGCDLDADGDGVPNDMDNCPEVANVDQADADGDGRGNLCPPPGTYSLVGQGHISCVDIVTGAPTGTES
ncbi:MAG: thrombospondin type 3 repeat-containing protein, partial [Bradymonadia bacterium]